MLFPTATFAIFRHHPAWLRADGVHATAAGLS